MADYSQLPEELIDLFMQRLTNFEDCIRSEAVCKSWQSIVATCKTQKRFLAPLLMLTDDDTDAQDFRTFYCLSGKRDLTIKLPDIHGKTCRGTPYGWMITFGLDFNTYLLNPFSRVWLSLPQVSKLPHNRRIQHEPAPHRFILSSNPSLTLDPHSEPSCIVIAMYTSYECLALAKPGDKVWTDVDVPLKHYEDAIYLNGFLYAIADDGTLVVCDISACPPSGTLIEASPPFESGRADRLHTLHLADISGELHLVVRIFEYFTDWFSIFKFGLETKTWTEVSGLGENALFIGSSSMPFLISTRDYPDIKPNAIYYSYDVSVYHDIGWIFPRGSVSSVAVYDMAKQTSEPFYLGNKGNSESCRPLFLIPRF